MSIPKFLLLPATYCMIFMYQVEWQTRFCKQLKATVIDIVVCNANLTTGDRELQKFETNLASNCQCCSTQHKEG